MRKALLVVGLFIVAVIAFGFFLFTPERLTPENPEGKTPYYTQVNNKEAFKNSDGRYEYNLPAYSTRGEDKVLNFTSSKSLREGAYLELYTTTFRGVTYWQEIPYDDLPERVKKRYQP